VVDDTPGRSPADLAKRFLVFAENECRGRSPLYERLSVAIAGDEDLLRLAAAARERQPVPNLLFGAVQLLLLKGEGPELARFYRTLGSDQPPEIDPFPAFRAFCLGHADAIAAILRVCIVQTAHARRCALLLPAFALVSRGFGGRPLALIEVGASAGLNLVWDRYGYKYSNGRRCGDPAAAMQLTCELRGPLAPPLPDALPEVGWRLGLDLNPIDLGDPEESLWLRALIWPDEPGRAELLRQAIAAASGAGLPRIIAGDALKTLPAALAEAPRELPLCVYHSFTLNQFSGDARREFNALLAAAARTRDLAVVSLEALTRLTPIPELTLRLPADSEPRPLAHCDPHGAWLEWADSDSAVPRDTGAGA